MTKGQIHNVVDFVVVWITKDLFQLTDDESDGSLQWDNDAHCTTLPGDDETAGKNTPFEFFQSSFQEIQIQLFDNNMTPHRLTQL